jgi:hypothetical protein
MPPLLDRPFFLVSFSTLLVHEMDAVRELEWRVLFPFNLIKNDEAAHIAFTGAHVPVIAALLLALTLPSSTADRVATGLSLFSVGHAAAHAMFRWKDWGGFRSLFSKTLIFGAAAAGVVDLVVALNYSR